ncbi:allantoinase AllB [Paenibacillus solisilvae]|uniref:Allantoinase n=1 Tax=Paenibacillus solisilvae TaxID=2486751 RepID=A0ABW0VUZ4_9BACL
MNSEFDFIVRNGNLVQQSGVFKLDMGIRDGCITAIEPRLEGGGCPEVDAAGMTVMPGGIDVHVHLNEPGMGHWEGFRTGSASLAAGGTTTYADMPLNGRPPTVTAKTLHHKIELAEGNSAVDYALWGGLMPGYLDRLDELAGAGAIGFKAFMSSPGMTGEDDFREVDDQTLLLGMEAIARLGGILALHAENEEMVSALAEEARQAGRTGAYDYSASRPVEAEVEAVKRALTYAKQTGCRLHFVHMSSVEALAVITAAKRQGMDVTSEVCTHHLILTEDDLAVIGPAAKCAPPLRNQAEIDGLWEALVRGEIDMIASDHSPCPTELKASENFFEAWGGVSGAQHRMELMIDEAYLKRGIPLSKVAELLSGAPADRFGLSERKGRLAAGQDADFVFIDLEHSYRVERAELLYLHPHSPFIGRGIDCKVMATYCRGNLVYAAGSGVPEGREGFFLSASIPKTGEKKVFG